METNRDKFGNTDFYKWVSQRNFPMTKVADAERLFDSFADNYDECYTGDGGFGYSTKCEC